MKLNLFKKTIFAAIISTVAFMGITKDTYASTPTPIAATCVANESGAKGSINCDNANPLAEKIEGVVKTLTGLVGAFAVGMIVYGGFKYITSQGDPKAAEGAKNIIWYAGVGLFIVLLAFMIFSLIQKSLNITG